MYHTIEGKGNVLFHVLYHTRSHSITYIHLEIVSHHDSSMVWRMSHDTILYNTTPYTLHTRLHYHTILYRPYLIVPAPIPIRMIKIVLSSFHWPLKIVAQGSCKKIYSSSDAARRHILHNFLLLRRSFSRRQRQLDRSRPCARRKRIRFRIL